MDTNFHWNTLSRLLRLLDRLIWNLTMILPPDSRKGNGLIPELEISKSPLGPLKNIFPPFPATTKLTSCCPRLPLTLTITLTLTLTLALTQKYSFWGDRQREVLRWFYHERISKPGIEPGIFGLEAGILLHPCALNTEYNFLALW